MIPDQDKEINSNCKPCINDISGIILNFIFIFNECHSHNILTVLGFYQYSLLDIHWLTQHHWHCENTHVIFFLQILLPVPVIALHTIWHCVHYWVHTYTGSCIHVFWCILSTKSIFAMMLKNKELYLNIVLHGWMTLISTLRRMVTYYFKFNKI